MKDYGSLDFTLTFEPNTEHLVPTEDRREVLINGVRCIVIWPPKTLSEDHEELSLEFEIIDVLEPPSAVEAFKQWNKS